MSKIEKSCEYDNQPKISQYFPALNKSIRTRGVREQNKRHWQGGFSIFDSALHSELSCGKTFI